MSAQKSSFRAADHSAQDGRYRDFAESAHATRSVFVPPQVFAENLQWMLNVVRDEPELGFGILGLYLDDWSDVQCRLGPPKAEALMEGLIARLESLLGEVDLAARNGAAAIHLLLPNNDAQRIPLLLKSMRAWLDAESRAGAALSCRASQIRVDRPLASRADADQLLETLGAGSEVLFPPRSRMRARASARAAHAA